MDNIRAYLESHEFFGGISSEGLDFLARHAETRALKAGELLFKQDDAAKEFYLLQTGDICVEIPSLYGPPLTIQHLSDGAILGWSWLIEPYQWAFEARVDSDTTFIAFDGQAILAHCESDPVFGYQLMKRFATLMSERLEAARLTMMDTWAAPGMA